MSVIKSHDVIVQRDDGERRVVLRPLTDKDLPWLYKWNADPEVTYFTEGGEDVPISYTPEDVNGIYHMVSQNALCFLVEVNGEVVGDCWLQRMNLPSVLAMYPNGTDVRRIDLCIGEKHWWGKGIGTQMVRMLMDYAFRQAGVQVLHCICEDYNIRSCRVWEKNGFRLTAKEALPQPQKGQHECHWVLTKEDYSVQFVK